MGICYYLNVHERLTLVSSDALLQQIHPIQIDAVPDDLNIRQEKTRKRKQLKSN